MQLEYRQKKQLVLVIIAAAILIIGLLSLLLITGGGGTKNTEDGGKLMTVKITEDVSPIYKNPGKGFVFYGVPPQTLDGDEIAKGNLIYSRMNWVDMEPEEKQYNWDRIDKMIASAKELDMKIALGFIAASSDYGPEDGYVTPKWVFDAGARYYEVTDSRNVTNKIPYWESNPIFLEKQNQFIKALAERYDGNPYVEFVDIRGFGNWGEFHIGNIGISDSKESILHISSDDLFRDYIKPYIDAFKTTQLMLPYGQASHLDAYKKAVSEGVGMRRDGIPDWSDGGDIEFAAGKVMTVTEYTDSLKNLTNSGIWNDNKVFDALIKARVSYTEISRGTGYGDNLNFIEEKKVLMQRLANRIGYHFVAESVTVPSVIYSGKDTDVSMTWKNKGVTRLFNEPCYMALSLIDGAGKVVAVSWLSDVDVHSFEPGDTSFKSSVKFDGVKSGDYSLAVAMFLDKSAEKPGYRLGIEGEKNGWYTVVPEITVR